MVGDGSKTDPLGTARPGVIEILGSSALWLPFLHLGRGGGRDRQRVVETLSPSELTPAIALVR